jgi:hypothetical protein
MYEDRSTMYVSQCLDYQIIAKLCSTVIHIESFQNSKKMRFFNLTSLTEKRHF